MVSRNLKPQQWVPVRMAVISYEDDATLVCNCGWKYRHPREKIRENAADKHLAKRHDSRGIRV
jgi:hypothetical protein